MVWVNLRHGLRTRRSDSCSLDPLFEDAASFKPLYSAAKNPVYSLMIAVLLRKGSIGE